MPSTVWSLRLMRSTATSWKGIRIDSESVVLRSDFDFAGFKIFDRLIGAAMAELQFEGFSAERLAENLVAEANAENRKPLLTRSLTALHGVAERGGIARAVGKKNAGGFVLQRFRGWSGRRDDLHFEPCCRNRRRMLYFIPKS